MYKVINFGSVVSDTGEARVQILNTDLVKTAANEIQTFWADLSPNDDRAYLHVIAMSAWEFYGPNNNGDSFYEKDLKKYHPSFVKDGNIFLHHANKDPKKSAGKPIFSFYNENMHRVELILAVNKKSPNAVEVLRRLDSGEQIYVSMGVQVGFDICSICNKKSKTRTDYCDHLKYNMKRILKDGRQVHAFNPGPLKFFDISLVNRPADRTAWALAKIASEAEARAEIKEPTSAELGEIAQYEQAKLAAISKLSDIIKYVDGDVIDIKDTDTANRYELLRKIKNSSVKLTGWPSVDEKTLTDPRMSPGGMLRAIVLSGGIPSLFESACICGRHFLGDDFSATQHVPMMVRELPCVLSVLQKQPNLMDGFIRDIAGNYIGEPDSAMQQTIILKVVPVVKQRVMLIRQLVPEIEMQKQAADTRSVIQTFSAHPVPPEDYDSLHEMLRYVFEKQYATAPGNMDKFTVVGSDGKPYTTTRWEIDKARKNKDKKLIATRLLGAAMGLASLGAAAVEPSFGVRVLAAPALAIAAYKMLTKKVNGTNTVQTIEGYEVPATAAFESAARSLTKQGEAIWPISSWAVGMEYASMMSGI